MRERERRGTTEQAVANERAPAAGKRTSTAAIQRRAAAAEPTEGPSDRPIAWLARGPAAAPGASTPADAFWFADAPVQAEGELTGDRIGEIASAGVAGASSALPHRDAIQAAFGHHDVSGVRAAVGGETRGAASAIGASAYATGDRVAFAETPDLHTAAHEAAHVVQQRAGVHLKGGVGQSGDAYEQHADRVADLVVSGRSAERELDLGAGGGATAAGPAVQRKLNFRKGTEYLDINGEGADIAVPGYRATLDDAHKMNPPIEVIAEQPKVGVAAYTPDTSAPELEGTIRVAPLAESDLKNKTREYNDRLIAMAHETRHGIDDLTRTVKYRGGSAAANEGKIHTEWRAFATQSAVALQLDKGGEPISDRFIKEMAAYASKQAFMHPKSPMVGVTASYMKLYGLSQDYSEDEAIAFMKKHVDWVEEAIELFQSLFPKQLDRAQVEQVRPSGAGSDWTSTILVGTAVVVAAAAVLYKLAQYFGYL